MGQVRPSALNIKQEQPGTLLFLLSFCMHAWENRTNSNRRTELGTEQPLYIISNQGSGKLPVIICMILQTVATLFTTADMHLDLIASRCLTDQQPGTNVNNCPGVLYNNAWVGRQSTTKQDHVRTHTRIQRWSDADSILCFIIAGANGLRTDGAADRPRLVAPCNTLSRTHNRRGHAWVTKPAPYK